MLPSEKEIEQGRTTTRRSYCTRACAARQRATVPVLPCSACGSLVRRNPGKTGKVFCGNECYLTQHRREPRACGACLDSFLPNHPTQRFCSTACMGVANRGAGNPNHGKRHPGMWSPRAEHRQHLSESRVGEGNPNWKGGSKNRGHFRFQHAVSRWCLKTMPLCPCGLPSDGVQHIVPRKAFPDVRMAHFAENLIGLCVQCHHDADNPLLYGERGYDLRYAERLPQPILDQWRTDGRVSLLPQGLDWSPLGNVAKLALDPQWFA